jgi:phospholipid/cholesterol/gamma-HCH transport system ATP-binding protein
VIRLAHVNKSFRRPGEPGRVLLDDVSLEVTPGTLYGLVGPGASGKTVLLKTIAGLMKPDSGTVEVGGHTLTGASEVEAQEARRSIGMLFQNNALFDHMSVLDNVAFPLRRLGGVSEQEVVARVAERLRRVSLAGFEDRMPAGLSGGQKKRVGVARATITRAPVVLYDEPAAGLDPVTSQKIFDLLREEQQAAMSAVVMVSSDLDRLLTVTDRVGMMIGGRLVFDGTTREARVTHEPRVRQFIHGLVEGPL